MEGTSGVIIGTYENALVGFEISGGGDKPITARLKFTNQCHIGHILTVASHSQFVASGGDDETIRLLDIRKGVELGTLIHHEGSLKKLTFHESAGSLFLVCASTDGTISIWKCAQWDCLHALTGHKGAVSGADVHPSGRFLLSVGADRTLMTWNLMTGRQAFIKRLPKASSDVKFSPGGSSFYLVFGGTLDVYETSSVSVACTVAGEPPVSAAAWWADNQLLTGHQDGSIVLHAVDGKEVTRTAVVADVHKSRVKCFANMTLGGVQVLLSASSDGLLVFWKVKQNKFEKLSSVDVPGRPVCMAPYSA